MKFSINKLISRPAFAPISLVILICLFFVESVFRREVFLPYIINSEILQQWRPYINYLVSMLSSGEVPLWSHNLMGGFPLAAFPHAALFYPPFLVFMAFDFMSAFPFFVMFHLICRVLLVYGLLMEWPRSRFASWLGAAIYGLSGCSIHMSGFLMTFDTVTWIPGIYWFALRLSRRGRWPDFFLMILFSALGYLGGCVESLLYSGIILFVLLIYVERVSLKRLLIVGLGLLASIVICAAPLLLTLHYLDQSFRKSYYANPQTTNWEIPIIIIYQLVPILYNTASPGYLGFLLPVGFLATLRDRKNKRFGWVAVIIVGLSLIYILNPWPLGYLFNVLPVIRFGEATMRLRSVYGIQIMILILATGGFERLIKGIDIPSQWLVGGFVIFFCFFQVFNKGFDIINPATMSLLVFSRLILILFLILLMGYLWKISRPQGLIKVTPSILVIIFLLDLFTLSYLGIPRTDPKAFESPIKYPILEKRDVTFRIHMISLISQDRKLWKMFSLDHGPGFIYGYIRNETMRNHVLMRTVTNQHFNPFGYQTIRDETKHLMDFLAIRYLLSVNAPVWGADPQSLDSSLLKSSYKESGEYVGSRPIQSGTGYKMPPGSAWTISLDLIPGDALCMSMEPAYAMKQVMIRVGGAETERVISWKNSKETGDGKGRRQVELPVDPNGDNNLSILVSAELKQDIFIISPEIVNEVRPFKKLLDGPVQLYENRHALDRYGIYTAVTIADDYHAVKKIFDPQQFNPSHRLVLSSEFVHPNIPGKEARTRRHDDVRVNEFSQNRVVLETKLKSPAYLSIAEFYYPGWRAWVDGEEVKVIRANYAFQAIALPEPGPHRIVLKFLPVEFRIGLWASITSALLTIFIAIRIVTRS